MKGTQLLCAAVVTHREIGPGETQTATFDLQASLSEAEGDMPAPTGTYRFEVCYDWTLEGQSREGVLEAEFEVISGV